MKKTFQRRLFLLGTICFALLAGSMNCLFLTPAGLHYFNIVNREGLTATLLVELLQVTHNLLLIGLVI